MPKKVVYNKTFDDTFSISNSNLQEIIKFFLFECPVPGKSVRGKKFSDYGINGITAFAKLKKSLIAAATDSLSNNYVPCLKNELSGSFTKMETVAPPDEYCVFMKTDEKTVMQSLFSAIRNAFAHGSFRVKRYSGYRIYDLSNNNGYLKAEMALHEETLLNWIKCVKDFS